MNGRNRSGRVAGFEAIELRGGLVAYRLMGALFDTESEPFYFLSHLYEESQPEGLGGPRRHGHYCGELPTTDASFVDAMEYERTEDLETDLALLSRPHTLADYGRRESDPRRYIDALERPYLVLDDEHAQLGDHVIILAPERKRLCHAVIGEHRQVRHAVGSQALVELLNGGSARSTEVIGLVFPRTGLGQGLIPSLDRVASVGRKLWERAISDGPAEGQLWSEVLACAFEGLRLAGPIEDVSPRR